jgi:hypothetical protein
MEQKVKTAAGDYFFNFYNIAFNEKLNNYQFQLDEVLNKIEELVSFIKENFTEVPIFGKLDFNTLEAIGLDTYIKTHGEFYNSSLLERAFILRLKELHKLIYTKQRLNNCLITHKNRKFNKIEFKWLINNSVKIMVEQMITKGKKFKILTGLGVFRVVARKRGLEERSINQYATQKNKEKLEAEGKTVKTFDNPDGVPYVIYYTDDYFYRLKWIRQNMFEGFDLEYKFKGVTGNNSIISRIYNCINNKPEVKLLYQRK